MSTDFRTSSKVLCALRVPFCSNKESLHLWTCPGKWLLSTSNSLKNSLCHQNQFGCFWLNIDVFDRHTAFDISQTLFVAHLPTACWSAILAVLFCPSLPLLVRQSLVPWTGLRNWRSLAVVQKQAAMKTDKQTLWIIEIRFVCLFCSGWSVSTSNTNRETPSGNRWIFPAVTCSLSSTVVG